MEKTERSFGDLTGIKRKIRKLYHVLRKSPLFYFEGSEDFLKRFTLSEWPDYELWLFRNRLFTLRGLKDMHGASSGLKEMPLISVLMPAFNPNPPDFAQAVRSVLWQAYPRWELCIVDDGSKDTGYLKALGRLRDPRVRVFLKDKNTGITDATAYALGRSRGEFVAFMDQDDEIPPDALFRFAEALNRTDIEYFYSDKDMISPAGRRYMHFFKPGWSPEYLLSFNYVSHLEIYLKRLLLDAGGIRPGFEGSQDYDLALRATERTKKIYHFPSVLYSWRQSRASISLDHEAKSHIYESGARAVLDAAKRRGLPVRDVVEDKGLWRGHFRILWDRPPDEMRTLVLVSDLEGERKRLGAVFEKIIRGFGLRVVESGKGPDEIMKSIKDIPSEGHVFMADDSVLSVKEDSFLDLLGYLSIDGVYAAGCRFLDSEGKIYSAGLSITGTGRLLFSYRGGDAEEAGYGAAAKVARNVSAVLPSFWGCRADELKEAGLTGRTSGYFLWALDTMQGFLEKGGRVAYVPYMCLVVDKKKIEEDCPPETEGKRFYRGGKDSYYNPNLTDEFEDFGIRP